MHRDGLRGASDLHAQGTARRGDAQVLISETTHEVKRLLRRLLLRQSQRVRLHLRLDRSAHVRRRAKESIRRHRALDALMRTLEVVVLDEEPYATDAVLEVGEDRLSQKLLPQRLPETLDLAKRLRVLRTALAVLDTVTPQSFLKLGLAAPRCVLPTLVGQHLARLAVVRDAALQRFDHETRLLVMRHRPGHEVARVVVHEADEVDALMSAEFEGEDVALPELIRLRALETARRFVARLLHLPLWNQPRLVQDATHVRLGHTEPFEASEHIPNPSRPPVRMRFAQLHDLRHRRGRLTRSFLLPFDGCQRRARHPKSQRFDAAALE